MDRTVVQQPIFADSEVRAAALLLDLCLLGLLTWLVFLLPWIELANPAALCATSISDVVYDEDVPRRRLR